LASLLSEKALASIGRCSHEGTVDDSVHPAEVVSVFIAVGPGQIGNHDARDRGAVACCRFDVDRDQVPPLAEFRQHALGNVAGRTGEDDTPSVHWESLSSRGRVAAIRSFSQF
jgi:hypothetical protein